MTVDNFIFSYYSSFTHELFDKVHDQLKRDSISRETREFAFTKMLTCGLCGSGITAIEKFKKLKDGTTARYVYYGCTRSRDLHCGNRYMREEDLVKNLLELIDNIDMYELGLKERVKEEMERYNKFQALMGFKTDSEVKPKKVDMRTFVKYILKEGSMIEKRELLSNMRSKLVLTKEGFTLQK